MKRQSRGGRDWVPSPSRPAYKLGYGARDASVHEPRLPKFHNSNQYAQLCQDFKLLTNAYYIKTSSSSRLIHEYRFSVITTEGFKDLPPKVLTRNFVSRSIRQLVMEEIVPKLTTTYNYRSSVVIDSNLEAIYSSIPLNLNEGEEMNNASSSDKKTIEEFRFNKLLLKTDLITSLYVDIAIKYARSISLASLEQAPSIVKSIIHHQLLLNMIRYGSVYYESHSKRSEESTNANRLDLISQHIMGISLSGLKVTADNQKLIVINCPHSYITQSHRLIDLLASFITGRPQQNLPLILSQDCAPGSIYLMPEIVSVLGNEEWFMSFCSILRGFKCEPFNSDGCVKLRFQLSEEAASTLMMEGGITVQEYYHEHLGITLTYPNLPCIVSKLNSYPFELCSILPDQKVPIFRLSSAARLQLSNINKSKPDHSKAMSIQARDKIESINDNIFRNFEITLSKAPVEARGTTLPKPALQFQENHFEPQHDYWESGVFFRAMNLMDNWCIVNTVEVDLHREDVFFHEFSNYCKRFGFLVGRPSIIFKAKQVIMEQPECIDDIIDECKSKTEGNLRFIMFIIDSSSTPLNRLIHLSFDDRPDLTATCMRADSINNRRQQRSIFRTLVHKLNARLGGTNVTYDEQTLINLNLNCDDLLVIGLDVTHPDNELNGVSIVGCAYTYSNDLFRHRSLVWPQAARTEIIGKMDSLLRQILQEYCAENKGRFPKQIIIYRDGVSHEEFEKVKAVEVAKALAVIEEASEKSCQIKPSLSFVIAQKRHTMRFFRETGKHLISNPPSGTLIDRDVVTQIGREFYLYSNTSPQATARPLHYHVLLNGLGIETLQKLTYILCFNFGKCSGTLSMPSSLKYAHNAAYDARNRVINSKEFNENQFYPNKFFC